jgi:hypothetical protein
MITTRRALPVAAALTFVIASCGGSSDGGSEDTEVQVTAAETVAEETEDFTEVENTDSAETVDSDVETTDEAPPEETAAEETAPEETAPDETAAEPGDSTDGDAAAAAVDVSLVEWAIEAPAEYAAGEITFTATNNGSFPHEFVVIEGEGYEALPLAEGGAVIEDDLPTGALIGRTARVAGGSSEVLTVTLAPGNYVLLCNLGGGGNSHAGQGQRLDITVS